MHQNTPQGLLSCDFNSHDKSYCYLKVFELAISAIIVSFSLFEIYKQFQLYGVRLHWKIIALIFIVISLLINIFFCLWNSTYQLFSLETFFNSLYFLTIVGDVCHLYIKKSNWNNFFSKYGFYLSIAAMFLLYTAILIDSLVNQNSTNEKINCEQIWYLCINVICLTLCIIALIVVGKNQKQERKRMDQYNFEDEKVYSPFKNLWIWIGINTAAQLIDLIQTGLLLGVTADKYCMIIPNSQTGNNILKFFFALTTLDMGYLATLWYLRKIRSRMEGQLSNISNSSLSDEVRITFSLQMLQALI